MKVVLINGLNQLVEKKGKEKIDSGRTKLL